MADEKKPKKVRPKRVPQPKTKAQRDAARDGGLATTRRSRTQDRGNRAVSQKKIDERRARRNNTTAVNTGKGCVVTAIMAGVTLAGAVATLKGWA